MDLFAVRRTINGKLFQKDEDRVLAKDWDDAEVKLMRGIASGKYDETCYVYGALECETEISTDEMLDIMIDRGITEPIK